MYYVTILFFFSRFSLFFCFFCLFVLFSRWFFFWWYIHRQVLEESNEASEDALAAAQADGLMSDRVRRTVDGSEIPEIR